ncbi:MAG: GNAT family N-acetyltransferase [Rhodocyclaceae bacterium]|nr:GNAT family N-acetyltransferase [Rhodocyclaceae bacterium]MBK6908898.1 GNAT family N-acetyltransferase [Rhodocyclaceae bacterium]
MTQTINSLGQNLGAAVPDWQSARRPEARTLTGRFCRLEALSAERHADALFAEFSADSEGRNWTYLPYGPFASAAEFATWVGGVAAGSDPLFFAIVDPSRASPVGIASYLRIVPEQGTIEVGHLNFAPAMQRTPIATEAMWLMMREAFALGYRRYEWKCNALNEPSRRAAQRLGFSFEGIFRQAAIVKGCNRDTAWYAVIDRDWPALDAAFQRWLAPENFAPDGYQRVALTGLTQPLLAASG